MSPGVSREEEDINSREVPGSERGAVSPHRINRASSSMLLLAFAQLLKLFRYWG